MWPKLNNQLKIFEDGIMVNNAEHPISLPSHASTFGGLFSWQKDKF